MNAYRPTLSANPASSSHLVVREAFLHILQVCIELPRNRNHMFEVVECHLLIFKLGKLSRRCDGIPDLATA